MSSKAEITKVKREGYMYRVYKKVGEAWKLKRTFFSMHQAKRYEKGMHK